MAPKFNVGDRVRCLASRFNEEEPDRNGQYFAGRHRAEGNGEYCHGVIKWVYSTRGRNEQMYRVLYDGDPTQLQSAEGHLEEEPADERGGIDRDSEGEGGTRIDNHPDEGDYLAGPSFDDSGNAIPMGGSVTVGSTTWTRVEAMGVDVRFEENEAVPPPRTQLKNMSITGDTGEWDILECMLPVTLDEMLECVKYQANEAGDKYKEHWYREHIIGFILCLYGGSLYKVGTDLWSKEPEGLRPAPDFGKYISRDRFDRVRRYLSRGPEGAKENLTEDPWAQVRWLIDGFNDCRRREVRCGASINPDESMWAWTGKSGVGGLPHLSFVKRKPEPLGAEFKTVCDGESGVMMYMEVQEGAVRMARKPFLDQYKPTTACTLRLVSGAAPNTDGKKRTVYADSWFMSMETRDALSEELGYHSVGCIKTAHRDFPAEALRWTLKDTERGTHVVFKNELSDTWAIGWNDVHFKLYLATCGQPTPGEPASKMRQRADGRNTSIDVPRPSVVAEYAKNMGGVDMHNRFRQGYMALHKVWRTTTWQNRIVGEVLATCAVDAFLLSQKFMPKWKRGLETDSSDDSKFFRWLGALTERMVEKVGENDNVLRADILAQNSGKCKQVLIGKKRIRNGSGVRAFRTIQERCRYCSKARRQEKCNEGTGARKGAFRTAWTCSVHGGVYMCRQGVRTCWAEHLEEVAADNQ